jgi:ABC-type branched-subunit amino acid transport system ATPase component
MRGRTVDIERALIWHGEKSKGAGHEDFASEAFVVDKDIEAVKRIADRCVIIARGRIVHDGTPATLAADHQMTLRHLGV